MVSILQSSTSDFLFPIYSIRTQNCSSFAPQSQHKFEFQSSVSFQLSQSISGQFSTSLR